MSRAYTVDEVDALRSICERRWLWGSSVLNKEVSWSRSYKEEEKARGVEELVRTAMIAGHTADDIYEADKKRQEEIEKSRQSGGNLNANPDNLPR